MSQRTVKLLLPELEAEVLTEALDLYLSTRRVPADPRYEYRYRAARAVLDVLQRPVVDEDDPPPGRRLAPTED